MHDGAIASPPMMHAAAHCLVLPPSCAWQVMTDRVGESYLLLVLESSQMQMKQKNQTKA